MIQFKRGVPPLCACGCEGRVEKLRGKWNKFIRGHNARGQRHSMDTIKRMSLARMGKNNPFYGKQHSEECKAKQSQRMKGNKNLEGHNCTEETRQKISKANMGKKRSESFKAQLSERMAGNQYTRGYKHSEATKAKISKKMVGNQHTKGHKHSEETLKKMRGRICSDVTKRVLSLQKMGHKNPQWKGGIASGPYCDAWLDKDYKESIKIRDRHKCQNPDCRGNCNYTLLEIHHVDYNKKNCHPWNLITLCKGCNSRANSNREYWQELYQGIIEKSYPSSFSFVR